MGMDVYGKKPKSEKGKYFRNNVWWWRPLAEYVQEVAPMPTAKCRYWHSNDGAGLNGPDSATLANRLQEEIDSGRCREYAEARERALAGLPDVDCDLCGGTGTYKPAPECGAGDAITGIKCNVCEGRGKVRPWSTNYAFSLENVESFVEFLRDCGGFEIW
jgi:hypothetical protein